VQILTNTTICQDPIQNFTTMFEPANTFQQSEWNGTIYVVINELLTMYANQTLGSPITYEIDWEGNNATRPSLDMCKKFSGLSGVKKT
jgi:hypothetical protein